MSGTSPSASGIQSSKRLEQGEQGIAGEHSFESDGESLLACGKSEWPIGAATDAARITTGEHLE
jgi:hypothetical protein